MTEIIYGLAQANPKSQLEPLYLYRKTLSFKREL
jgi:hypothetical protein